VRIDIDLAACAGHGQCAATSPDVYHLDDDGFVLDGATVADGAEDDAREGASACPENAITIRD
jgi:ferredoxin